MKGAGGHPLQGGGCHERGGGHPLQGGGCHEMGGGASAARRRLP